eukprot:scaffold18325_cov110-Skeletonema_marinoi.AAC.3
MSEDNHAADTSSCASCGIAKVDDIKLKECDDCDLVKYCSVDCERDHKSQHKEACKKRAAELRDELLFKQPDSTHLGDCPICMIPLPLDPEKATMASCCSKMVCIGCGHANQVREIEDARVPSCPFCRELLPTTKEGCDKQRMKRIEANDPVALRQEGIEQDKKGNYISAFEYYTKAAELGDVAAHYWLSRLHQMGTDSRRKWGK